VLRASLSFRDASDRARPVALAHRTGTSGVEGDLQSLHRTDSASPIAAAAAFSRTAMVLRFGVAGGTHRADGAERTAPAEASFARAGDLAQRSTLSWSCVTSTLSSDAFVPTSPLKSESLLNKSLRSSLMDFCSVASTRLLSGFNAATEVSACTVTAGDSPGSPVGSASWRWTCRGVVMATRRGSCVQSSSTRTLIRSCSFS